MIAKRAKKSSNRSLVNTFCYVVDTRKSELDNDVHTEGKAEQIRISNMGALNLSDALLEMQLLQSLNTRSKSDKNYHLIVSFPPDEKPSKEILEKIEDELIESIGLADHQRVSAVHNDTDHYHLHVLINKVHPVSYN
uniref:relaxase/mobilization nuclease domain-containing protein n=2 Tax=Gammaproteobacteria TaxID=1236 RepID=UPI0013DB25FA